MEQPDDFDSLLKGAAGQYGNTPLTEQSVSTMIDERLAEGKKKLISEFRTEIRIIAICIGWSVLFLTANTILNSDNKVLKALNFIYLGIIVYLTTSLFMFIRLMQVSRSQKDTHVKDYLAGVYNKTKNTLKIYLWISTVTAVFMAAELLTSVRGLSWYKIAVFSVLFGAVMHFTNIWYIKLRFRKRLKEMEALMIAFD